MNKQINNKLNKLFSTPNIIGLIANVNEGKSNAIYWILETLNKDFTFNIFVYGLRCEVPNTMKIYSVNELEQIKDSVIILDEFSSLFDVENRKMRRQIENTLRLIFHNNNVLLLCGLGENFKKFISAKLSAIIFKKTTLADLINGSNAKNIIMNYKGMDMGATLLNLGLDEAVLFDGLHYHKFNVPYLPQYDTKIKNVPILVPKSVSNKIQKK